MERDPSPFNIKANQNSSTCLDLNKKQINTSDITTVCYSLLKNPAITKLNLSSNRIDDDGISILVKFLPKTNIKELDLSNNYITDQGAIDLFNIFNHSKIETCNLSENEISRKAISYYVTLKICKEIKLYINNNKLTHKDIEWLRLHTPKLKNLKVLGLGSVSSTTTSQKKIRRAINTFKGKSLVVGCGARCNHLETHAPQYFYSIDRNQSMQPDFVFDITRPINSFIPKGKFDFIFFERICNTTFCKHLIVEKHTFTNIIHLLSDDGICAIITGHANCTGTYLAEEFAARGFTCGKLAAFGNETGSVLLISKTQITDAKIAKLDPCAQAIIKNIFFTPTR